MKEVSSQEEQLTAQQGRVLNLILSWLGKHDFSEQDCQKAKNIWLRYLKRVGSSSRLAFTNTRLWAAAVLYTMGKFGDVQALNVAKLAATFEVSTASIRNQGEEIYRTLAGSKSKQGDNLVKQKRFFPSEGAAKAFHELIAFTQQSEEWMNYVAAVFEEFILWERASLSFDLLLELLLFTTCDRVLPGGKSIIDHYLDGNQELVGEERSFLEGLQASRFSIFQVETTEKEGCFCFKDLFRGDEVQVEMDGVIPPPASFMMGRLMPVTPGEEGSWHPAIFLCALKSGLLTDLDANAKKWFWEYSVAHKGWATAEEFMREKGYRFLRWYLEHYAASTER